MLIRAVLESIVSYMPLIFISLCPNFLFGIDVLPGVLMLIWKFGIPLLPRICNKKIFLVVCIFQSVICCMCLAGGYDNLCILVLGIIVVPWLSLNYKSRYKVPKKNYIILVGMVLSSILLENITYYALFYLLVFAVLIVDISNQNLAMLSRSKLKYDWTQIEYMPLCNAFFHNLCYYSFIISLPVYLYNKSSFYMSCGGIVALSWVLFFPRKKILNMLLKRNLSLEVCICSGYLICFITIGVISCLSNMVLIGIVMLIQGIGAGLAEGFFFQRNVIIFRKEYTFFWRLGGGVGCVINVLLNYFFSYKDILVIVSLLYLIMAMLNISLFMKKGINMNREKS